MNNRMTTVLIAGLATVLCLTALFTPWWTGKATTPTVSTSDSSGPFNTGDSSNPSKMITTGQAMLAGILTIVAFLACAATTGIAAMGLRGPSSLGRFAPIAGILGTLAPLTAASLAVFTWPTKSNSPNTKFWESTTTSGISLSVGAALGWYLALACAALAATTVVFTLMTKAHPAPNTTPTATTPTTTRTQTR